MVKDPVPVVHSAGPRVPGASGITCTICVQINKSVTRAQCLENLPLMPGELPPCDPHSDLPNPHCSRGLASMPPCLANQSMPTPASVTGLGMATRSVQLQRWSPAQGHQNVHRSARVTRETHPQGAGYSEGGTYPSTRFSRHLKVKCTNPTSPAPAAASSPTYITVQTPHLCPSRSHAFPSPTSLPCPLHPSPAPASAA